MRVHAVPATITVAPDTASEGSTLDRLVAATPASRDRVVDAARALCIVVVTLWHSQAVPAGIRNTPGWLSLAARFA
jgi:hypothetical protein